MTVLELLGYAAALALLAVTWAVVLVETGMLLAPVQRWLREAWRKPYRADATGPYADLDACWWWKPLWGCFRCTAGQWAFWGYLLLSLHHRTPYSLFQHLTFTAATIMLACILNKIYLWSQS